MKILRTIAELRDALATARREAQRAGGSGAVGLVPTMGALHEGHLSLVRRARADNDVVVISIFVNPTQFTDADDLDAYPRDERRDAELAAGAGADFAFVPAVAEMYPEGFATLVRVSGTLTETLEGAVRGPEHFDGVATVVSKLLFAADADAAYFGEKDAQQVRVVQRMVADLAIPTRIVPCPTSRDDDGVARSSRNARLSPEERARAAVLPRALRTAAELVAAGERSAELVQRAIADVLREGQLGVDYVAVVDSATLEPVSEISGPTLCLLAARAGSVRLLDNIELTPASAATEDSRLQTPTK